LQESGVGKVIALSQSGFRRGLASMLDLLKEGISEALQNRTLICHSSGVPAALCPMVMATERTAEKVAIGVQLQEHYDAYRQVCSKLLSSYPFEQEIIRTG
jgi:hypothetical protein